MLALGACATAPATDDRIAIAPSPYLERISDARPGRDKLGLQGGPGDVHQGIADDAFERSPLHAIAASLAPWFDAHPDRRLLVESLRIELYDRRAGSLLENSAITLGLGGGSQGGVLGGVGISFGGLATPGDSRLVVVELHARVDDRNILVRHVEQPRGWNLTRETIVDALHATGSKLNARLVQ